MTLALPGTTRTPTIAGRKLSIGRAAAASLGALAACGWASWFAWRLTHPDLHPISIAFLVLELLAAVGGLAVTAALVSGGAAPGTCGPDDANPRSIADRLPHGATLAHLTVATDGVRRCCGVVLVSAALLFGSSPFPMPAPAVLLGVAVGLGATSLAQIVATRGRVRPGDRLRWSYTSQSDLFRRRPAGVGAGWTATMATLVVVSLAAALRGISDRWTHGLDPMTREGRLVAMSLALMLALGAAFTLLSTEAPQFDNAHLVARRHEERTARQLVLVGALVAGIIGLVAGLLPGGVDTTEHDPARIEQISERPVRGAVDR